ncbi:MAG: metal ABC transporter permease [Rhodospirillales bacterium]|nr:metal ABC transporter permease [Rhodospirillales bacterium]
MDDFLLRALLGGIGVALIAGPLGSFVVWRRMAFFGDTLAHSALLGVVLGVVLGLNLSIGVIAVGIGVALVLTALQRRRQIPGDTLLGILSHGALALGLVAIALTGGQVNLTSTLFGDVLSVTGEDLAWVYGGGAVVLVVLVLLWNPLLATTVDEELAQVDGVNVIAVNLALMGLLALTVALAMKVVGVLLVTALLIIPAAAARRFARTPERMAVLAAAAGCLSVAGGLGGSLALDTPTGPTIVVAALFLFVLSAAAPALSRR